MNGSIPRFLRFHEARDLDQYSEAGYKLLGVFLIVPCIALWLSGYGTVDLSRTQPMFWKAITLLIGLSPIRSTPAPANILSTFFVLYTAFMFLKSPRRAIGESFANFVFRTADIFIQTGEWCIEHRWGSVVIIMALISAITSGTYYLVQTHENNRIIKRDFDHWFEAADAFAQRFSTYKPQYAEYSTVRLLWKDSFVELRTNHGEQDRVLLLRSLLESLHSREYQKSITERKATPYPSYLYSRLGTFLAYVDSIKTSEASKDTVSQRAGALTTLLLARILAQTTEAGLATPDTLVLAHRLLENLSDQHCFSAKSNLMGTLYACAANLMLEGHSTERLRQVFGSPESSLGTALNYYEQAAAGYSDCSYEHKRLLNNKIDAFMRIGLHYDKLTAEPPIAFYLTDPTILADSIDSAVSALLNCNDYDPFIPLVLATVSQAYGVCASLYEKSGKDPRSFLVASGMYLRLANSFAGPNLYSWDMRYLCSALLPHSEELRPEFLSGAECELRQCPRINLRLLTDKIVSSCQ